MGAAEWSVASVDASLLPVTSDFGRPSTAISPRFAPFGVRGIPAQEDLKTKQESHANRHP